MRLNSLLLMLVEAIPEEWPVWVSLRQFSKSREGLLTVETLDESSAVRVWVSTKLWIESENSTAVTAVWLESGDPIGEAIEAIRRQLKLQLTDGHSGRR